MKFLGPLLVLIVVVLSLNNVDAIPSLDSQMIYDSSEVIVIGKVISLNSTFSPTHNLYQIQVEKFLKNQLTSDILLAAGQNTVSPRLGNQVFSLGDKALFFLNNDTIGYDRYEGILGIFPESQLVEPEWDSCNIFEENITRDHWFLGGRGVSPKIQQGTNSNVENFKKNEMITVTYDVSNLSESIQEFDLNGTTWISNGTTFEIMSKMNQHIILEPCTAYKTIEWRFTPGMSGSFNFEIQDPRSGTYGLGFIVTDNIPIAIESPLKQFRGGTPISEIQCKEGLALIAKLSDYSPACVKPETSIKLYQRGWAIDVIPCLGLCGTMPFHLDQSISK